MMHAVVRKYAHAYLNVNNALLTLGDIQNIERFGQFLQGQRRFLFFLRVPTLGDAYKKEGLDRIYAQYPVPESFYTLIQMLLDTRRMELICDICVMIGILYKEKNAIHEFQVISSYSLSSDQKKDVEQFLTNTISGTILCTYTVSHELIAGIRIQSNTMIWEHSINQQLRAVHREQRV